MNPERFAELVNNKSDRELAFVGSNPKLIVDKIMTGVPVLDTLLGGGLPRGRIVEIFGSWSSGKSLIAQVAIGHAQKLGEFCVYIDVEKAFDPLWAEAMGIDLANLVVIRPNTGEEAFDLLEKMCSPKAGVGLAVLDSIAQLIPTSEAEEDMAHQQMGVHARLVNKGLRKVVAANDDVAVILINQIREKIGVVFGSPETKPGGKGQDFATSISLRTSRGGWLTEGKKRVGHIIKVTSEKNKLAPPFQTCEIPFYYKGLVDREDGILGLGLELGIVERSGAWYKYESIKVSGRDAMLKALRDNPDVLQGLRDAIEYGGE